MSKPVVVSIPHRIGKQAALARLKSGFTRARTNFGHLLSVEEELWSGDHLQFCGRSLGQVAAGTIDVAEDHVRLEVTLPWLRLLRRRLRPRSATKVRCYSKRNDARVLLATLLALKPVIK
jgi:hypothetical protein